MSTTTNTRHISGDTDEGAEIIGGWLDYVHDLATTNVGPGAGAEIDPVGDLIIYTQVGRVRLRVVSCTDESGDEHVAVKA